ncbi:MAG: class I SAM-dependent methyltransferase, partial [Acidimicrobiales bacterium]
IDEHVIERFGAAGIPEAKISVDRDTFVFEQPTPPSEFLSSFRNYYGPTMNAFEAAEAAGRAADLQSELEILFKEQNQAPDDESTSIPATFLRVTVQR